MRVKELHPLCCIPLESPEIGAESPEPTLLRTGSAVNFSGGGSDFNDRGSDVSTSTSVAGVLYKWTNYGKGWRSRWFTLRSNGVLSYSKTRRPDSPENDVVVIGSAIANRRNASKHCKNVGIVHLKVSSFRESKADDRRFYIFTATKTLHLRTNTKKEKVSWIQALISIRSPFQLRLQIGVTPHLTRNLSISTERLKRRLLEEGIGEGLVKECEQIMLSEFSHVEGQFQVLCEERSNLLVTLRQLEATNIEAEVSGINVREYELMKQEYTNLARGKYSEWSTTESSDDVGKQELEEASDEEESHFFDTNDYFLEPTFGSGLIGTGHMDDYERLESHQTDDVVKADVNKNILDSRYPHVERRKRLPDPIEKEKRVSLWSMIKDNIGKDLTRVCLPVYFNEPISSLQKCFEDLEYSHLLDQAYKHGKEGNSVMRILSVAAFAVSGYASSEGRHCKPFNPLLGETYEADYPEKGIRFFSEKVSHHPTVIACHCEGKGWKFWGDTNLKSKFWGRSIQLDPVGTLNLEFDDGEIFQWSKVTTSIYNLILGNIYCDHHGTMHIRGNREYSCKLKFKEQSILDRNPHQVHGFVEDATGKKVAQLFGKWDDSMCFINGDGTGNVKGRSEASLLWKRNKPSPNPTRYNLTSFAITLNELTPGLKEKLPPTDSRLRPDQRYLENGEYDKANVEKLRLEMRQRMSRKLQEHGWKPKWFQRDGEGAFHYVGGYWEARQQAKWDSCPDIFGEISQELINSLEDS
ncbi:oxysterol-binding protein-related protein 2A [Sesamum indicum]|uniref:Oxysterol-binding protein-related protein 2A n=1 Tax=Sesamum indicum TaxID=4182 RepID=A0A6I9TK22_SESIN|nr:oxysterol-binding protein-related protein 2A [Sesamum indicum]